MTNKTVTAQVAQHKLEQLIQEVNETDTIVEIIDESAGNNAVLVSLADWKSIQETLFLSQTGTLNTVKAREKDDSGSTPVDDIDWGAL
ncbi:type II toxin-antitoxin system Phd/YefM family antitoxin [Candidatus Enterococcus ferrettii]|uniref:Antitoxin n=1 Tax=Candidatus Enterococcus ferrettii TaxID=2815324 RepID=A0ABV0EK45_9ENTE|nr:type II toxin-antitoxin system prevent-host-death family antitoxin [Enterococcus sp. 665A]MBO1338349.1 type II toxin-antitoxin system prevent-host-death family antitoxin [Enterococcus sp. 665A]